MTEQPKPTDADREMAREFYNVSASSSIQWLIAAVEDLATLIATARAQERERCAGIAHGFYEALRPLIGKMGSANTEAEQSLKIAAAIRGTQP